MVGDKNEIDKLIDTMIESGDELVKNLKTVYLIPYLNQW